MTGRARHATVLAGLAILLVGAGAAGCAKDEAGAGGEKALTFAAVPSEQNVDPTVRLLEDASGRKVAHPEQPDRDPDRSSR